MAKKEKKKKKKLNSIVKAVIAASVSTLAIGDDAPFNDPSKIIENFTNEKSASNALVYSSSDIDKDSSEVILKHRSHRSHWSHGSHRSHRSSW